MDSQGPVIREVTQVDTPITTRRVSFEVALYRPIPKGFKLLAGDKRSTITGFGRHANMIPKGSQRALAAIPSGSNHASTGFRRWSLRSTSG